MPPIVVGEFRSTFSHAVGGPDKTILVSAAQHDPDRVRIVPFFLVPAGDPAPGLAALARNVGVEPIIVPDHHRFHPRLVTEMRRRLAGHGCHILHTHDFKTDFLGLLVARGGGVRLMATAHGWSRPLDVKHRLYNAIDYLSLRRHPLVLAVSRATADRLVRRGVSRRRIRVLPNGIDTGFWSPPGDQPARPPGLPMSGRIVGMVARLSPDKDVEGLVEAFTRVGQRWSDLHLVVAGDGPLRERLEGVAARSPLARRIHLLGHRTDLRGLYGSFDVSVLSSRAEGMPNSLLEAMATGRAVVASAVGGVPEVARHEEEALLVPPGDPEALAGALARVLGDEALAKRLGEAARRRVEEHFSFARRLRRLEGIYEAVAAGRIPDGTDPAP